MNKYQIAFNNLEDMVKVGGTLAEADEVMNILKQLVTRSIPRKPKLEKEEWGTDVVCPCCKTEFGDEEPRYCCECGQAIDWSVND